MAELPYLPLATDAYLADTGHLTTIEHGAYLLLLIAMWRSSGTLPDDDRLLAKYAHLTPTQWQRIKPTIAPFFVKEDGKILQPRLTDELAFVRQKSKTQSSNARTKWRKLKGQADATGSFRQSHGNAPTPTPTQDRIDADASLSETGVPDVAEPVKSKGKRNSYPEAFEEVWAAYPTDANMSKFKAHKAWAKLDAEDRAKLLASIPGFLAYCKKNPTYRPAHLTTFINDRRFDGYAAEAQPRKAIDWPRCLEWVRQGNPWSTPEWGPMPGQPGCRVPAELLLPGDGKGWREWGQAA